MIVEKLFSQLSQEEDKKLNKLFHRQNMIQMSWEQMTGQAKGLVYILSPFLEEIYKDDPEELEEAYKRHFKYFNCTPNLGGFIIGLIYAMEKTRGRDKSISGEAISDIRIALCGPLAGVGDTLCQNVLKILVAGLTMGLAAQGNVLGPILFMLLYGGILYFIWKYTTFLGYSAGTKFLDRMFEGGLINSVTKATTVLGLCMVGAMTASIVSFKFNWVIEMGETAINIQEIIDSIFPGLLAVALTFGVLFLVKKKFKVVNIVYGIMVICLLFAFLGIV